MTSRAKRVEGIRKLAHREPGEVTDEALAVAAAALAEGHADEAEDAAVALMAVARHDPDRVADRTDLLVAVLTGRPETQVTAAAARALAAVVGDDLDSVVAVARDLAPVLEEPLGAFEDPAAHGAALRAWALAVETGGVAPRDVPETAVERADEALERGDGDLRRAAVDLLGAVAPTSDDALAHLVGATGHDATAVRRAATVAVARVAAADPGRVPDRVGVVRRLRANRDLVDGEERETVDAAVAAIEDEWSLLDRLRAVVGL